MKKKITKEPIQVKTTIKKQYRIFVISEGGHLTLAEDTRPYSSGYFDSFDSVEDATVELENKATNNYFYDRKEYIILPVVCVTSAMT